MYKLYIVSLMLLTSSGCFLNRFEKEPATPTPIQIEKREELPVPSEPKVMEQSISVVTETQVVPTTSYVEEIVQPNYNTFPSPPSMTTNPLPERF